MSSGSGSAAAASLLKKERKYYCQQFIAVHRTTRSRNTHQSLTILSTEVDPTFTEGVDKENTDFVVVGFWKSKNKLVRYYVIVRQHRSGKSSIVGNSEISITLLTMAAPRVRVAGENAAPMVGRRRRMETAEIFMAQ